MDPSLPERVVQFLCEEWRVRSDTLRSETDLEL